MKVFSSLFLLLASASWHPQSVLARQSDSSQQMKFTEVASTFLGLSKDTASSQSEDMLVIGAGLGRTGTTSFVAALDQLGLQSYNMKAAVKSAGHLDLWQKYIDKPKERQEVAEKIMDAMATSGFNATSSMPANYIHQDLMKRYPNARVVLTVRSDGDGYAWNKSVRSSIYQMMLVMKRAPFSWIPTTQKFLRLGLWCFGFHYPENPTTPTVVDFDPDQMAAAYTRWVDHVKTHVPEDKLLVFQAKEGWGPLCEFLSSVSPDVEKRCQEIIASGQPYPRVNESTQVIRMMKLFQAISNVAEVGPYVLGIIAVTWMLVKQKLKAAKQMQQPAKKVKRE